ncbi:MAG: T9SS type A sorting domain-containing protein [Bacteroidota bacterium]
MSARSLGLWATLGLALLARPLSGQPFLLEDPFQVATASQAQYVDLDLTGNLGLVIGSEGDVFSATDNGLLTFYLYQTGETGPATYSEPIPALDGFYTALAGFAMADLTGNLVVDGIVAGVRSGQAAPAASIAVTINNGFPFVPLMPGEVLADGLLDVRVVRLADLNRDGNLDAVAFYTDGTNVGRAVYFPGDGAGSFGSAQAIAAADRVRDVRGAAIADANGDGAPDVATASTSANEVLVFVNNGSGGFGAPVVVDAALTEAQDVALGDLNGDGRTDVVAVARGGAQVAYYPGDGSGGFGAAVVLDGGATDAVAVDVGDIDQDGDVDVVTAQARGFVVYPNAGDGTLFGNQLIAAGTTPRDVLLGDAEQDGDLDLTVVDRGGASGFYRKTATTFPTASEDATPEAATALAVYPNPARDYATIELGQAVGESVRVTVHDLLGRTVAVLHDGVAPSAPLQLDTRGLAPGCYLVRVASTASSQGVTTRPLVVAGR